MAVKYVGPYTGDAYKAANLLSSGYSGAPYSSKTISSAKKILGSQGSVLGSNTVYDASKYYQNPGGTSPSVSLPSNVRPSGLSEDTSAFEEQQRAAEEMARAQEESNAAEYDRQMELLSQQESSLGTQRTQSLAELQNAQTAYESKLGTAKTGYADQTEQNILSALGTAKDVEKKNRNVLRGLGILNSSAAGEMLQKPYDEYSKQRALMTQDLQRRQSELDDALLQQQKDYQLKVSALEQNYADLVGQIQIDRRFTNREKSAALQQVQATLVQAKSQIDMEMSNWKNQVAQYNNQLDQEWAQLGYNPASLVNNTQPILSAQINTPQQTAPKQTSTYGNYNTENLKKEYFLA